ncbi:hypothetical protein SLEP1_g15251 [Rubroshorea leprosula]|uniref:Mechanosensitive ion channel protein n=1 Tax=Rubroshorea leprosula TaxID=152421 RepID=A0AAV5IUJ5_9ROSI|nr:hypothetical protein SLEP1_g15251 [Rubroshorea leprosula]
MLLGRRWGSQGGGSETQGNASGAGGGNKIWRESSYDFFSNSENMKNRKEDMDVNGSSGGGSNDVEDFDFMQSKKGMDDPPSKLIGQFLHRQKASGEISLDMDLEMDELQPGNRVLPPVSASPSAVGNLVSFEHTVNDQRENVRRRQYSESPAKEDGGNEDEVVRCSSNASYQRQTSNLLKTRTKSRLMDPPTPERTEQPRSAKAGAGKSGLIMRSGFIGKTVEEEEEDPLFEEDLPEDLKKEKLSIWVLLEWVSLILIIAALICSLTIPYLRKKKLWKLMLWKWEVLVLVLICGRLVSGWIVRIIVFFIERNFLLRKRVLYFVYGLKKAVQNCLWLGLALIAWHYLFDKKVARETNGTALKIITKILVCLVVGVMLWLVKTLLVKVLASSFHMSTYFDRIQDSLFNQYVIEALSGPPLIEIQKLEEEEEKIANEVRNLQNAGATIPAGLRASPYLSPKNRRVIGSGRLQKSPQDKTPRLSRLPSKKGDKEDRGISIDHLHKLNPKNVSAWNMKRLMNIIRHGALSTLDEQIQDSTYGDESTEIKSEYEAKIAARKIFQNVAKPGSKYLYLEDIERFMREDEALKTMSLFEGGSESKRISKSALKNWVVNAFRERRALALTLNDTKTAVNRLHRVVNVLVGIIIVVIWLLILGIATSKFLLFVSSQLVVLAFIFGNTLKTIFEAIIFLFVMHPFDVGDRCEIDGVQMVVEEMNILNTIFLRYDNQKIIIPNSVLATKAINNYYRSPDMGDAVEFCVHITTPAEKIAMIKQRILSYIENKKEHWYPAPMFIFKDVEELNRVRFAVWLTHRMNHQDMGERWVRRALLVEEMTKIFRELDIPYRLYPVDVNIRSLHTPVPNITSDRVPPNWTTSAS